MALSLEALAAACGKSSLILYFLVKLGDKFQSNIRWRTADYSLHTSPQTHFNLNDIVSFTKVLLASSRV